MLALSENHRKITFFLLIPERTEMIYNTHTIVADANGNLRLRSPLFYL